MSHQRPSPFPPVKTQADFLSYLAGKVCQKGKEKRPLKHVKGVEINPPPQANFLRRLQLLLMFLLLLLMAKAGIYVQNVTGNYPPP